MHVDMIREHIEIAGSIRAAARILQVPESTLRRRLKAASGEEYAVDPLPKEVDIEELIAARVQRFASRQVYQKAAHVRTVRLRSDDPIGIGFQGDGHLDDDGTNIKRFFEHAELFNGTQKGLYLGFLGDVYNNWVGKLVKLWANQGTTAKEAQALVEHYFTKYKFLFVLLGNHDVWNQKEDVLQYMLRDSTNMAVAHEQRIKLVFPNGREVIIHARHKFPGSSQWVTQFGQVKAAQLDGQSDIYVGGDKHVSGYSNGIHPGTRRMYHALQVASYKEIDEYPVELGLAPKDLYLCPVAVINPKSSDPLNLIRWEFDPNEGAKRLAWERSR